MTGRILSIVVIAGLGLLIWQKNQSVKEFDEQQEKLIPAELEPEGQKAQYFDPDVEGEEPGAPPDFHVDLDLRIEGPRYVMHFTITESHGWYVDHIYAEIWYVQVDENGDEKQIGDRLQHLCHSYLDFNSTLQCQTTLQDHEFEELFSGEYPGVAGFGTTENWRGRVANFGKVLAPRT